MRFRALSVLWCTGLLCLLSACAATWTGPTDTSGYFVNLEVSPPATWLGVNDAAVAAYYPTSATVVVHVRDRQGRPVDGVAVDFRLEPAWVHHATLTPAQALTRGGLARALFTEPKTTGRVQISAQVENLTTRTTLMVKSYTEWRQD